jgi:hypothetical protein
MPYAACQLLNKILYRLATGSVMRYLELSLAAQTYCLLAITFAYLERDSFRVQQWCHGFAALAGIGNPADFHIAGVVPEYLVRLVTKAGRYFD